MSTPLPMTRSRLLALLLGVPIALVLIAWTGLTEVAYAGLGSYPVRLAVPVSGSTVSLSAGAADVQVTQAAGSTLRLAGKARYSLFLSDGSGNLTLRGLTGPVTVGSGSGDVQANALTGTVNLQTGSGNITGGALSGPKVTLKAGSGDIAFDSLQSLDVVVTDGSGNIDLTFSKAPTRVKVSNSSGNVNVVLPRGVRYQVNATTDY